MPTPPTQLLRFSETIERIDPAEAGVQAELVNQLLKISQTTYKDGDGPLRAVHAKTHGLLKAKLIVPPLDATFAQGLFATPGEYQMAMRFSTSPGDLLPDSVSTPRGLAIKVFDVPGERLTESQADGVQDFALVTGKAFSAKNAAQFLKNLKMLAATTDRMERTKIALSAALRATEAGIEALGGKSATLDTLGGHPATHVLAESYFSQVPIRFGAYVAKIGVFPVSPELTALVGTTIDLGAGDNVLREAVSAHFAVHGGTWEVRAQLCTDLDAMPVEDATAMWDESKSPYIPVARIEALPQESWSDEAATSIDRTLTFNPWHGLAAHRPPGSIMRARKVAYPASARFRLERAGCPMGQSAAIEVEAAK